MKLNPRISSMAEERNWHWLPHVRPPVVTPVPEPVKPAGVSDRALVLLNIILFVVIVAALL